MTTGGVLIAPLVEALLGPAPAADPPTTSAAPSGVVPGVVEGVGDAVGGVGDALGGSGGTPAGGSANAGTGGSSGAGGGAATDTGTTAGGSTGPAAGGAPAGPAPASSGMPAPDVRAVVAAPALAAPGGLAAARVPVLNFGTPNAALLLTPAGSPLRALTGQDTGSPVTTTSDVQAIAFENLPGGMGTPAVVGVLILSTLGAFALRHRIFRRARAGDSSAR
ncbi:hypothetical protein [Actinomycetospora flava]|uniref:Uncharacterized protein n=1 Tax=Actinomycetospora flava TaxID=3129232 RepID=A0ABU8MFA1_9PSEU